MALTKIPSSLLDTTSGLSLSGDITLVDNDKAIFGTGSDLQIYHDGSHSYIDEQGTGRLYINSGNGVWFGNADASEIQAKINIDGACEFRYDNALKLATTSTGIDVTGTATMDGLTVDGNAEISSAVPILKFMQSDGTNQNAQLRLNSNSFYINQLNDDGTTNRPITLFNVATGDVSFYEDTGTTAQMTWDASADALTFTDNTKAVFGAGSDLEIFHTGLGSYIIESGTGNLFIRGTNLLLEDADGNDYIAMTDTGTGGTVEIKHNASTKLTTTATGIDVTGNITVSGTVDGRDVATDGTKLDGIEANATADQTQSEINALGITATGLSGTPNITVGTISSGAITASTSSDYPLKVLSTDSFSGLIIGDNSSTTNGNAIAVVGDSMRFYTGGTTSSDIALTLASNNNATFAGTLEATSFSDGTISGITFIDEDSFATNSATRIPTQQSIKAYVDTQVAGVVDSAPAALDTLNELAAALGDDANFSTTTSTALGNRLRVDTAAQGLTGTQQANAITNLGITATKAELNFVDGVTSNIQTQLDAKLASSSYTAADVLTKIKTVDGAGSGLDADLLDGISSASFLRSDADDTLSGNLTVTGAIISEGGSFSSAIDTVTDGSLIIQKGDYIYSDDNSYLRKIIGHAADTHIYIGQTGTALIGNIILSTGTSGNVVFNTNGTETAKFDSSGNLTLSGTVDGRDVASDGSKLDGIESGATADQTAAEILTAIKTVDGAGSGLDADLLDGISSGSFLRSDVSDVYDGRVLEFGNAGNGSNTSGAFLTIEGNTDASGEGSGRLFFREHNSTTASADNYGMSLGYRGGATTVTTAMGNSWTGLTAIGNGEWGMWGHDNNVAGALIAHGPRNGSYADFTGLKVGGNDVWHAGNDGSGSGLDADTLDGLELHTGTNNVANRVVRTNASGYIMAGWINTTSGATSTTLTRIYCSQDGYIRYQTPANFGVSISPHINYNTIANTPTLGGGTPYLDLATGTFGTVKVDDDRGVSWAGYAIRDDWVFMSNGAETSGIYNDTDNNWAAQFKRNAEVELYHNGALKMETTSSGISVTGNVVATGNVTAYSSDERLKTNITPIENPIEKVKQLNGVEFDWKDNVEELGFTPRVKHETGVIAQNVQSVIPDATPNAPFNEEYLTVQHEKIIPVLIEAIKEQQKQIDDLKQALHEQKEIK